MKRQLAFASSLIVLAACSPSREALQALDAMKITQDSQNPGISYKSISGWGNDLTLNDVELRSPVPAAMKMDATIPAPDAPPPVLPAQPSSSGGEVEVLARAKTMTLKGLTMKDGKPLARDIVLNDLTPVMPTGPIAVSLGSFGFEGMNEATGQFIAGLVGLAEENAPPALEQWAFSKVGFGGLKVAGEIPLPEEGVTEGAEPKSGKLNVAFGEVSLSDMKDTKLGRLRLSGLKGDFDFPAMAPVTGTFDFGTFDVSNIQTKLFVEPFIAAFASIESGETMDYASLYKDFTSPLETGADRTDWTGAKVAVSGLNFATSELHSVNTRNADGVVVATETPRFSMKFTADDKGGTLGAMGLMMLAMSGYDSNEIEIFMQGAALFDPAKDLTRWADYNVGVSDFFDVKTSGGIIGLRQALPTLMTGFMTLMDSVDMEAAMDMDDEAASEDDAADEDSAEAEEDAEPEAETEAEENADADAEDASPPENEESEEGGEDLGADDMFGGLDPGAMMSLVMGLLPLQVTDFDIAITDVKLMNMIVDNQAIEAGQTAEQYRTDLVAMVSASSVFMTDAGVDAAIAQELSAAASGFLSGPGTLRIQIKPKTPLGMMSAFAMPLTKDSLGFSATFTPAAAPATN